VIKKYLPVLFLSFVFLLGALLFFLNRSQVDAELNKKEALAETDNQSSSSIAKQKAELSLEASASFQPRIDHSKKLVDGKRADLAASESLDKSKAPKIIPYSRILNLIKKEKLVQKVETLTDEKGVRSTLSVYANGPTKMRTTLQEDWVEGPSGSELIGWTAMAADYVMIKISGSPAASELAGRIQEFGAKITPTPIPGIYKVHFDGTDPIRLYEIKDNLKTVAGVDFAEPDYIMGIE